MSLEDLVSTYIASAETVLRDIRPIPNSVNIDATVVRKVVEHARAYLYDAKYFREKSKFETGLTSVAYCEGLLDALRLLGVATFKWPPKRNINRER